MNKKAVASLISICFYLTMLDIAVVEGYYRPAQDWGNIWKYHTVLICLAVALPLVASKLTKSLLPLGSWIFFVFGLEDTLFYGLQGYLPETYYGVYVTGFWEPTLATVLTLNFVGLITLVSFVWATWQSGNQPSSVESS